MSDRKYGNSAERRRRSPRFGRGAAIVFTAGALFIVTALVLAAPPGRIRGRIALRQAWFDETLAHHEEAVDILMSLRDDLIQYPEWQKLTLEALTRHGQYEKIRDIALEMRQRDVYPPEWMWSGWTSALRLEDAAASRALFPVLLRQGVMEALRPEHRLFVRAWRRYAGGHAEQARELLQQARDAGVDPRLIEITRAQFESARPPTSNESGRA